MTKSLERSDQAFIRYQETGVPEHLGQVFDETSAQLLKLAHHLTSDFSDADDLLQAVFLTAIERCQDYKPTGHVVSWLSGIMVNEARVRRRASGRNVELTSAELIVDSRESSQQEAILRKELSRAMTDAIEELPVIYRPVLNLHLRYGLSSSEIAVNLERAPVNVRKQLSRGMAMLRKALPSSLIAGTVILTTPVTGLSAMREVLMSKATAALAAKTAGGIWSSFGIGKLGLMAGAGTLTAAALAVSLMAPDEGQVTLDELSPKATASVVAQKGSVDFPATASAALQADPFAPSSRLLMACSFPVPNAHGGASTMNFNMISPPSFSPNLGVPALLLGAMTLLPALGQSQSVIYYYDGENASDNMGNAVSGAGDVNLDGYPDIVASASGYDLDPDGTPGSGDELSGAGRAHVYSGKDGTTLYTFDGENAGDTLGQSVSGAGDVDGDAFPDILAGANGYDPDPDGTPLSGDELSGAGRVYVYSGKDGSTLYTFDGENAGDTLGQSVSDTGDVNQDGNADITAGATGWNADVVGPDGTLNTGDEIRGNGRVYVYSGKDGTTLWAFDGENGGVAGPFGGNYFASGDVLGKSVSGAGDVNLDTYPDIIGGAWAYDADPDGTPATGDELDRAGRLYVYSGKDGTTLYAFDGEDANVFMGWSVSDAGDVDGDAFPDIVVGEHGYALDPDGTPLSGDEIGGAGRVLVYSGFDGSTLYTFDGEGSFDQLGQSVSGAGDVNSDGFSDIVAGAQGWDEDFLGPDGTGGTSSTNTGDEKQDNGRVYVYSGFDGTTLWTIEGEQSFTLFRPANGRYYGRGETLGSSVSGAGDVNGDGTPDIVAGARSWDDLSDSGRAGADGTLGTYDDLQNHGRDYVISGAPLSLTADAHLLSLSGANSQTMTIDAGVINAGKNYWLFTGFAASGDTPGVTMAPGVVIPLNQPDPLTSFVIGLTQLGGGAPTFAAWKSTLDIAGKGTPSLNTFGPTPAPLGVTLHHAALVYTSGGCGIGCDTFQLATNWVPMTTTP